MTIIQKGYGEVKLESGETVQGEVTLYAEGWLAVSPVPPSGNGDLRWFPSVRAVELVWKKNLAMRRTERPAESA
ncbi:MAG: hypothetical protein JXA57_01205 [Armatimonadetes bacterium]|nr:hypothetical protein [Armatimonadota bacterium]